MRLITNGEVLQRVINKRDELSKDLDDKNWETRSEADLLLNTIMFLNGLIIHLEELDGE